MSQADFGIVLMMFLIPLGFTLYVWLVPYRREICKVYCYKLFEVRDSLIWLVADGRLTEEDEVFQYLYKTVNQVIPIAKPIGLPKIVNILKTTAIVDPQERQLIKKVATHRDKLVRDATVDLLSTLADILISRSLFVKVARIGFTGYILTHRIRALLAKVFQTQNEAYELYQNANNMVAELQIST